MLILFKVIILNALIILSVQADFMDFFRSSPKLPSQAVEDHDVRVASCTKTSFNFIGHTDYSKPFLSLRNTKKKAVVFINGKKFENQPTGMIDLYRTLTNYNRFRMNSFCSDIECEITSLFGESYAHKLTYILKKFSYNSSHLANPKSTMFTEEELDRIIWALELFPGFMFDSKVKKLVKDTSKQGSYYLDVAGFAQHGSGNITLFNKWVHSTSETQVYTLVHEYAHVLGNKLGIDRSKLWVDFSRWNDLEQGEENTASTLVSQYAKSNYIEDFAESVTAYRLNPLLLKNKAPDKYEMIQKVLFLGIDYNSKSCESKATKETFTLNNIQSNSLIKKCEMDIISYKLGFKSIDVVRGCFRENSNILELKSLKQSSSIYSNLVQTNFNKGTYPSLSYELKENYIKNAIEEILDR